MDTCTHIVECRYGKCFPIHVGDKSNEMCLKNTLVTSNSILCSSEVLLKHHKKLEKCDELFYYKGGFKKAKRSGPRPYLPLLPLPRPTHT